MTFGSGGTLVIDASKFGFSGGNAAGRNIAADSDGRFVISGTVCDAAGPCYIGVARVLGDGTIDSTFGAGGTATVTTASKQITARGLVLDDHDRLNVSGCVVDLDPSEPSPFLARFSKNGFIDKKFGDNGVVVASDVATAGCYNSVEMQDDKLLAIGKQDGDHSRDDAPANDKELIARYKE